jgi:type I restriction enzyme S subunit
MIKYKRYERYKDSGVEWIGEIPEHWGVIKLKYVTKLAYGDSLPTENREEEGEVDVFGSNGKVGTHNVANTLSPVIIVGRKGSYGKVTYSDKKCFAIDTTYYIDNRCTKSNIKWLYYSLMVLELDKNSQDTGVPGLSREYAYNKYVPVPTVNEQVAIANFLDQKTAEIDGLIADKEKFIELLQEKRQAIITEAVTKGLNPNVRMKDSGIEWIGEIPEHWEVKKLKYVSNITMGQSPKSEECSYDEIGVPFLQGNAEFTNVHPIPKLYCNTANKFSKVNDILLSVRAPVGAMNISDRVYGIGRELCAITAKKIQVKYLWYSLTVSLEELFIKSKGSTFEAVTVTDVQNLLIILPPKNEQDAIVNFLDQKTAEIDSLVTETKNQIEKLKEYRQSLISEAVTGKIDVREFQNKNEVIFRNE